MAAMKLDCHIHMTKHGQNDAQAMLTRMAQAGLDGGVIISLPPETFGINFSRPPASERIADVVKFCGASKLLFPFFWIDPTADDAAGQVEQAAKAGVAGFKVICDHFYPEDDRAMKTFRLIAETAKPILFHSGILWNTGPSAKYNRPGNFECLIEVRGLRFALAHISWPWVDEHLAVYGKMAAAKNRDASRVFEMFIDTTPGTPVMYRREALTKIYGIGYDVQNNVMFGSDARTEEFGTDWARQWIERDEGICRAIGLEDRHVEHMFSRNLLRFVGASQDKLEGKPAVKID